MDTNRLAALEPAPAPTPAHPEPSPAPAPAPLNRQGNASRFRIPADVILRTCEALPDDQRAAVKWASGYCRSKDITSEEFGAMLRQPGSDKSYSGDSIYQAFTGRRDPDALENLCAAIDALRKRVDESLPRRDAAFIETSITKSIWTLCARALERQRISFLFGPSQCGKTTAIAEYQRTHNHGETVLVRMPTNGAMTDLLQELAFALDIPYTLRISDRRRRIMDSFDSRTLLIIDEGHQTCLGTHSDRAQKGLEFIREIWDRRKCGVVFCGTDVLKQSLRTSPLLGQLWQRRYRVLDIPRIPPPADIAAVEKAYGLTPAADRTLGIDITSPDGTTTRISGNPAQIQSAILAKESLGRYISLLDDAAESARETGSKLTWGRVILTHHQSQ